VIISGSSDSTVRVWDLNNGEMVPKISNFDNAEPYKLLFLLRSTHSFTTVKPSFIYGSLMDSWLRVPR